MSACPQAKSARAPKHRIPVGLQIVARVVDGSDVDAAYLRKHLEGADRRAARILTDPLGTLERDGAGVELANFAAELGAGEAQDIVAAAIPTSVTHDPHMLITNAVVPHQTAGLWLGLCLGYRLAASLSGKDGAQ